MQAKWEVDMRRLIAGMKVSVDEKVEGVQGYADWVEAWSEDYGLMPQVDACLLGAVMYPGYERYWTALQNEPDELSRLPAGCRPGRGRMGPLRRSNAALCVVKHPHFGSLATDEFRPGLDEIAALKRQSGKDIYLVGGARTTASLIDAGLVMNSASLSIR